MLAISGKRAGVRRQRLTYHAAVSLAYADGITVNLGALPLAFPVRPGVWRVAAVAASRRDLVTCRRGRETPAAVSVRTRQATPRVPRVPRSLPPAELPPRPSRHAAVA